MDKKQLTAIKADDGVVAAYTLGGATGDALHVAVAIKGGRAYALVGRSPAKHKAAPRKVFEGMWPTLRISAKRNWKVRQTSPGHITIDIE